MTDESRFNEKCDHEPCHCVPQPQSAVLDGESVYCSRGCLNGKGCEHAGCACGQAD